MFWAFSRSEFIREMPLKCMPWSKKSHSMEWLEGKSGYKGARAQVLTYFQKKRETGIRAFVCSVLTIVAN
ncbi:hypothetical protein PSCICN_44610 [Pseudomonas cichorii]|nr:hypothetical protein PSCICN_44610 [Pseudomonas cichorii]